MITLKLGVPAAILAGIAFYIAAPAHASNCGIDFQKAYEAGVKDGRADGASGLKEKARRHRPDFDKNSEKDQCYKEGYEIGYGNAAADANRSRPSDGYDSDVPTAGSNERAYYDDGCRKGTKDAKMSMSMAYQRHSDMYDTRFEPYFAKGYEACWRRHR